MYIDMRTAAKLRNFIRRVNVLSMMIDETDDAFFREIFMSIKWRDDEEMERAADRMNTFLSIIRDYAAENKDSYMEIIKELPQVQQLEVVRGGHLHGN